MKRLYTLLRLALVAAAALVAGPAHAAQDAPEAADGPLYTPMILIVDDDAEAERLESLGVIIWHRRADMALAAVPENVSLPSRMRGETGRRLPAPRRAVPAMDVAKTWFDAGAIHTGAGLPRAYTGKGVVTGFCDIAFDPNHINFKDADGNPRVKKLVCYDEPAGRRTVLETPEEIAAWTTDDDGAYHGTHVAGIMAGSYGANGFGGMAPDSEIVATTSRLYDAGILSACEDIIDYARAVGRPAVINLSIGSYNGPHDGSTLFNRYLSLLGREAIVCIAAGNEGGSNSTYRAAFTEAAPAWRAYINGNDWVYFHITGMSDAWSHDRSPVGVRILVFDTDTRQAVFESEVFGCDAEEFSLVFDAGEDPEMSRFMTGRITLDGYVSDLNGRHVTEVVYDLTSTATAAASDGKWSRYRPGLEFTAAPGVRADIHADSHLSYFSRWPGFPAPTSDLCVSDLATGDNLIAVGMYNNKSRIPQLSGTDRVFDFEPFTVNHGSGYGTLIDGRRLPHVVAPGAGVVSSSNRYYTLAHPEFIPRMNAVEVIDGETYYWGSDAGTSMSTPYLAGIVATWLEADPTLTVDDVRRALEATNTLDVPDPDNPRHGGGWFRPVEGLRHVLGNVGVGSLRQEAPTLRIVPSGDAVEIYNPGCAEVSVEVFSASGVRLLSAPPCAMSIIKKDLSTLPSGLYIVAARTPGAPPATLRLLR